MVDIVRLSTCGSVDSGKSTLIGRLLFDTNCIYKDQLEEVKALSEEDIDFSFFLDGLSDEREQGITIDVAYRYFTWSGRKYIIADSPGHSQYTRNMAVAASVSDVAIIVLDATTGVLEQTKRHSYVLKLYGITDVIVVINKMDMFDFDEAKFNEIKAQYDEIVKQIRIPSVYYVPVSAKKGDNVFKKSEKSPWYTGQTLVELVTERAEAVEQKVSPDFRMPVQSVAKYSHSGSGYKRGYQGTVTAGSINLGERVSIGENSSEITGIIHSGNNVDFAKHGDSITLEIADHVGISRGDVVEGGQPMRHGTGLNAKVIWFDRSPCAEGSEFLVKINNNTVKAIVTRVNYVLDINTFERKQETSFMARDIADIDLVLSQEVSFDLYSEYKLTGAFIIINPNTFYTAGSGVVTHEKDVFWDFSI